MASSNFGQLSPHQIKAWSMTAAQRYAKEYRPYPPGWKLGSIKRKGRPTIFLLWIDNVQMGPFNTMTARRRFINTTLELQDAEPG